LATSIYSYKATLQLIAEILSFQPNETELKQLLHATKTDWEAVVKIASKHLVLTTVYCRLKQKRLLGTLPEDLRVYLKELTTINRNRNLTLLNEIKEISTLLNAHEINHVFLKGCALLVGNYYKDFGERMIGDIDILVESDHIEKAFQLLALHGYTKSITFNYEAKNYRHLPRQISEDKFGAVELHKHILDDKHSYLIDIDIVISNKTIVNSVAIPSVDNLIFNTILAHQINDMGHYYNTLHYKYVYDCLVLNLEANKAILKKLSQEKYSSNFLSLMNIHFPEIEISISTFRLKVRRALFKLKLNHKKFRVFSYKFKYVNHSISNRLKLMIYNKSYRNHILFNKIYKNS